jgi:glycosyltransferase involved in cell wall biosynthesis
VIAIDTMPKVSVILAAYNAERYLPATMESLLAHDVRRF